MMQYEKINKPASHGIHTFDTLYLLNSLSDISDQRVIILEIRRKGEVLVDKPYRGCSLNKKLCLSHRERRPFLSSESEYWTVHCWRRVSPRVAVAHVHYSRACRWHWHRHRHGWISSVWLWMPAQHLHCNTPRSLDQSLSYRIEWDVFSQSPNTYEPTDSK